MTKMSTKVLSILLAAMMLVSMVPFVAFADGEGAPVLESLTPTADMDIHSSAVEGNTYTYAVDYWNNNFKFTLGYAEGVSAAVKTNVNAEITADEEGVYSLPLRQFSEYTYYIELTAPAADAESEPITATYTLKITRLYNDEADITAVNGTGFTATRDGQSWTLVADNDTASVVFTPEISLGASMSVVNELGQTVVAGKNGAYTVTKNTVLYATVTAQDGLVVNEWIIDVVVEKGNADCTIYGVDDAVSINNGKEYVANTNNEKFLVNVTVAKGATYKLYKDEECTEEISNKELTLTATTTTVYIKVTASDGDTVSDSVSLTINTTNVADGEDAPTGELPYGGYPELQVRGGYPAYMPELDMPIILVPLAPGTTTYELDVKTFGCDVVLYGDTALISLVKNNTTIKLDSGITQIYAVATKGDMTQEVMIQIVAPMVTTYKDKLTSWAAPYIEALNESGLGLLRGDTAGNFNGTKALNRYEMAALMIRLHGINKDFFKNFSTPFTDSIASWAANYVKAAYKIGLVSGFAVDGGYQFQGTKAATRNEFLRVLMNVYIMAMEGTDIDTYYAEHKAEIDAYVKAQGFKDADKVADWAKPGTYTAIKFGFIVGDTNGYINPTGVVTRDQAAVILCNSFLQFDEQE